MENTIQENTGSAGIEVDAPENSGFGGSGEVSPDFSLEYFTGTANTGLTNADFVNEYIVITTDDSDTGPNKLQNYPVINDLQYDDELLRFNLTYTVHFFDESEGFMAGSNDRIFYTDDSGQSFVSVTSPTGYVTWYRIPIMLRDQKVD